MPDTQISTKCSSKNNDVPAYLIFASFNARSICNKLSQVVELLKDHNVDVCLLSETWLNRNNASILATELAEFGYQIIHNSRPTRGGGTAVLFKKSLNVKKQKAENYNTFEVTEATLRLHGNMKCIRLSSVYRTCTNNNSKENLCKFFDEFESYLSTLSHKPGLPLLCGDLNLHLEQEYLGSTLDFMELIDEMNFIQYVDAPTHVADGILDVVMTKNSLIDSKKSVNISGLTVCSNTGTSSDHFLIKFSVSCAPLQKKTSWTVIQKRNFAAINMDDLKMDIINSKLCDVNNLGDVDSAVETYNNELLKILDKHAPFQEKKVKLNNDCKWWNKACQNCRKERRKAERHYKKHRTHESKVMYKQKCLEAVNTINHARQTFFQEKLETVKGDSKATYSTINYLLGKSNNKALPSEKSDLDLADEFAKFFQNKVNKIYEELNCINKTKENATGTIEHCSELMSDIIPFNSFEAVSSSTLKQTIMKMPSKHCMLDVFPTWLLKEVIDLLLPIIKYITDRSLETGYFPSELKKAVIIPSIKRQCLDHDELSSYRPISNLSFLSKIVEKCVSAQMLEHICNFNLLSNNQSGYRQHHSCETAITKIYNDLVTVADKELHHGLVLLLDMSAAFDTLQHNQLLQTIQTNFGMNDLALQWLGSYLANRSCNVLVNESMSNSFDLKIGVPQGSVLGPLLFILFTNDLESIASKHNFSFHCYADDSQFYINFIPVISNHDAVVERVEACLKDVEIWLTEHYLKINMNKTELIEICPFQHKNCVKQLSVLNVNGTEIKSSNYAKCLGFYYDDKLSLKKQINEIVRICNFKLSQLYRIGLHFPQALKTQLVKSYILPHLDYCNAVYYGINKQLMQKLQSVQNKCAKFIMNANHHRCVESLTMELHFLPVTYRIDFKIALLVHKCLNNQAPLYLKKLISTKQKNDAYNMRSEHQLCLLAAPSVFPKYKKCQNGFEHAAPKVWNKLPLEIRSIKSQPIFKKNLKTFFFKLAYPSFV